METAAIKNVLVFSTNISTKRCVRSVEWILNQHPYIVDWSIDLQDVDRVLRVVALENIKEDDVIDIVHTFGFNCEPLPDKILDK